MASTAVVIPYYESDATDNDNTGLSIDGVAATCTKANTCAAPCHTITTRRHSKRRSSGTLRPPHGLNQGPTPDSTRQRRQNL